MLPRRTGRARCGVCRAHRHAPKTGAPHTQEPVCSKNPATASHQSPAAPALSPRGARPPTGSPLPPHADRWSGHQCSPASTRRMMSRRVRSASAWNRASARSSSSPVTKQNIQPISCRLSSPVAVPSKHRQRATPTHRVTRRSDHRITDRTGTPCQDFDGEQLGTAASR